MAHIINLAVQEFLSHLRITPAEADNGLVPNNDSSPIDRIPKVFCEQDASLARYERQISCGRALKPKVQLQSYLH